MAIDSPNLIGPPRTKFGGFSDKIRKGGLDEGETQFVLDRLARGMSLKTIAPMINRPLSILQRAFPAVPRPPLMNTESK
jgi:hypothetical protein